MSGHFLFGFICFIRRGPTFSVCIRELESDNHENFTVTITFTICQELRTLSTRKLEATWLHPSCIAVKYISIPPSSLKSCIPALFRTLYRNNNLLLWIKHHLTSLGLYYGLTEISFRYLQFNLSNPSRYSQVSTSLASNELPPPRKHGWSLDATSGGINRCMTIVVWNFEGFWNSCSVYHIYDVYEEWNMIISPSGEDQWKTMRGSIKPSHFPNRASSRYFLHRSLCCRLTNVRARAY